MNIKKIDIFGTEYEIMYVDSIDIEKEFPDAEPNQTCDGLTDYDNRKIVVTTKSPDGSPKPKSEIQLTLLHELFHAFFQTGQYKAENRENTVEWLARCTHQALKQKVI